MRLRAVFGLVLLLSCARPPSTTSAAPIASPTAIAPSPPSGERAFHWRGRVADGLEVDVRAIRGDVVADGTGDGEVDISAVKSGPERSWRDLAVRMETTDRGVVFCVVDANGGPATEGCRGGREVHSSRDARVDFRVNVPRGVRFVGKSVDGNVSAQGLALPVALSAVNGRVRAVDVEATRLVTVNGSIVASLRVEQGEDVELSTVNGDIDVQLPALLGDEVAVAGPLVTTSGAREVRLLLGQGPGVLRARTVNGSVRLARSS